MINNEEKLKLLAALECWDENSQLYKYPQTIVNTICNRFNPMQTITLGQPVDIKLPDDKFSGPKAIDHYINLDGHKIYMHQTVKELKDYLEGLK